MGACETTPPTMSPGTPQILTTSTKGPFLAPDDPPPLAGVQLVRPRRCAAAGADSTNLPGEGLPRERFGRLSFEDLMETASLGDGLEA
jgi:hypothetical protein